MSSKRISIVIFPLLIVGLGILLFPAISENDSSIQIPGHEKHRGVCWVGSPYEIDSISILDLVNNNVNWISQTPFAWQRGFNSPEIGHRIGQDDGWWGETDKGLIKTTRLAKKYGIQTILKPHVWLRDDQGKWRGEIEMDSEVDWQKWFENYSKIILHYAKLAEEEDIELLCIGTELHKTCVEREADWRKLIAQIREIYSGDLTYAANFSDEYQDVAFWDDLDFIGVQGYFPVAQNENPSIKEVKVGWEPHIKELEKFSNQYELPVLFTEIGYKSTKDAGIEPWQWPQRLPEETREKIFSEEAQANLYAGMFEALTEQSFIAGFHFWKWYPKIPESARSERRRRTEEQSFNIDFTPQGKKAEEVMKLWFGRMSD